MADLASGLVPHLSQYLHPLRGSERDYDGLVERIGDARFVLIGEASHGSHEFYRERAVITRRLINEHGFHAVAVEADWPDAYRVNRYVRGHGDDPDGNHALAGFLRFPTWMWRNTDVLGFVDWLRQHNRGTARPTGFYGLDLYSLQASIAAVLDYLDRTDPAAAGRARERYGCFDRYGDDAQAYGYTTGLQLGESCEDQVVAQLAELRAREAGQPTDDGDGDGHFFAEQNARLVRNAEQYYRSMFGGRARSWNLRDRHMMETLQALAGHLSRAGDDAKIVVWAHNSHLGDARATEMSRHGELNLGQLVRESWPDSSVLIGLSTFEGTVTAASDWDTAAERKRVRPALEDSYEALFHQLGGGNFWLDLHQPAVAEALRGPRLQRAIGVIYRPGTERQSHYFEADLSRQFDHLLHFDDTRAVKPLELTAGWHNGDLPEAYPSGL
jgi:erythromycin esterase-like protein